ncbi:hypothetical protein R9C00_12700 [Flammeovirgaceae bacterium SG7u.111]|nr:hypothetical protein [Flammeovirgaceae bacterium SG7u.132]WPO38313.1 hypothetical protein R9C00_12700 [Flammeovirgaceae bacterium SG7u.111]
MDNTSGKTNKVLLGILATLMLLFFIQDGFATTYEPQDSKIDTTYSKSFFVKLNDKVDIRNRYGSIKLDQWDKDSVSIEVSIQAQGKTEENTWKIMDRIDVDFQQSGKQLTIETKLDGKSSTVGGMLKGAGDYSKNVLGKNPMKIDFVVKVPKYVNLEVTQKDGVVTISKLKNKTKINLSDAVLEADSFTEELNLELRSSKVSINSLGYAFLDAKSTDVDIKEVKKVDINCTSGEITIQKAKEVYIDARSAKLNLMEVEEVDGEADMTKTFISKLKTSIDFTNSLGNVQIEEVEKGFEKVNIISKMADVEIGFNKNAVVNFDVKCKAGKVTLPNPDTGLSKSDINKETHVTGTLGGEKGKGGDLMINAPSGKVILGYK